MRGQQCSATREALSSGALSGGGERRYHKGGDDTRKQARTDPTRMTPRQAIAFVGKCGLVLESARGPVPSLAETIAGEPLRASWWGHPKGDAIFACSRAVRNSEDVLTCRLIGGKVTYVHRRLWPALVRLAENFKAERLAAIKEIHTETGQHKVAITEFSRWIPAVEIRRARRLSEEQAIALLKKAGLTGLRSK